MSSDEILKTAVCLLYAVPILRAVLFFLPPIDSNRARKINAAIGRFEWFVHPWRDSVFLAALGLLAWKASYLYLLFVPLSVFSIVRYRFHAQQIANYGRLNQFIAPSAFFECYYAGFGFIPSKFPASCEKINPLSCSFRRSPKSRLRLLPFVSGIFNTHTLARLVVLSFRKKGADYARETAKSLSTIWGARVAELGNFSIRTEGFEKLQNLKGKFIFAFTHKSFLDFALGPFALSQNFSFVFLAARDHFKDNFFLYRIVGQAIEAIGTIFVDRRKNSTEPAGAASRTATERLKNQAISIAIFPQGTRAYPNVDSNGSRMDSGYYTSGTKERLRKIGGHLKKGAAYIGVDTAIALKERDEINVNIVPVGLAGTGLAAPKGSVLIKSGTEIVVKIAEPIVIRQPDVRNLTAGSAEYSAFVEDVHKTLDERLKGILEIHNSLEQRFFTDVRKTLSAEDFEHLSIAMKAWRGKDYLIFAILDCIYATNPKLWQGYLRELVNLIICDAPFLTLSHFKERVVERMVTKK